MFAAAVVTLGEDEVLQLSLLCYCRLNRWNLIRLDFFMAAEGWKIPVVCRDKGLWKGGANAYQRCW